MEGKDLVQDTVSLIVDHPFHYRDPDKALGKKEGEIWNLHEEQYYLFSDILPDPEP